MSDNAYCTLLFQMSSSLHDRHIDNQDRAQRQQPSPPTKDLR